MSTTNCINCNIQKNKVESLKTELKNLEALFQKETNDNSSNATSGNNRCCIDREEEIKKKENALTEWALKFGKLANEFKEKENQLKAELDEAKKKNSDLEREKKDLKTQNEVLLKGNTRLENENQNLNDRITEKDTRIAELINSETNLEAIIEELNERIDVLNEELEREKTSLNESKTQIESFEAGLEFERNEYKKQCQSTFDNMNKTITDYTEEYKKIKAILGKKEQNETELVNANNALRNDLKQANNDKTILQKGIDDLALINNSLTKKVNELEEQMIQQRFEANTVSISLSESKKKVNDLELRLAKANSAPELTFLYLDQAFEGYRVGRNEEIYNGMGLRNILLHCYPELFPDSEFLPSSGTGCKAVDERLSCQQNIVLSIAKLMYASENNWRIYSTTEKGENPIKDNIVETLKRNCFQLQINDELKCSGYELEQIIDYIYQCNLTKLNLSGLFKSKSDNYKKVFSKTIKHACFNFFSIVNGNKASIEISQFLKELVDLETVEWISPIYENHENFADVPRFFKLKEFKLLCYNTNFNLKDFGEFIKKHREQNVKFIVQFRNWRDNMKNEFQKQAAEIRAALPQNCQLLVEFN